MIDEITQKELRARFNPDGSDLRKLQLRLLEMLKFIDSVCRENDIKYWLSSGTCLGAVRHGGFIPWDDDVDIEMLPEDYNRFCDLMQNFKYEGYALQTYETDKEYLLPFAKVRDLNTSMVENNNFAFRYKYSGLFLDIFPVYPSSSWLVIKMSYVLQVIMLHKLANIDIKFIRRGFIAINHYVLYNFVFPLLNSLKKISRGRIFNVGGLGSGFLDRYDKKCVDSLTEMEFEGIKFPIPGDYEKYLTSLYGNYNIIPPLEKIHIHIDDIVFYE